MMNLSYPTTRKRNSTPNDQCAWISHSGDILHIGPTVRQWLQIPTIHSDRVVRLRLGVDAKMQGIVFAPMQGTWRLTPDGVKSDLILRWAKDRGMQPDRRYPCRYDAAHNVVWIMIKTER